MGWFGYETRPPDMVAAFWEWMAARHGWDGSDLQSSVSPSVGTSIGVLISHITGPDDGVILQPPVFTDFKALVQAAGRTVVRNALSLTEDGYRLDLDDLATKAADPSTRALILCNPHNPVGRVWTQAELTAVARICARTWSVRHRRRDPRRPRSETEFVHPLRRSRERLRRAVGRYPRTDKDVRVGRGV